jgi:hypothetical protein
MQFFQAVVKFVCVLKKLYENCSWVIGVEFLFLIEAILLSLVLNKCECTEKRGIKEERDGGKGDQRGVGGREGG